MLWHLCNKLLCDFIKQCHFIHWTKPLVVPFASEETPPLPAPRDGTKTTGQDESQVSEAVTPKGKKTKGDKDEIQIEVTAKLGGIDATVTSVEGDFSHIVVGGKGLPS